MIALLSPAKTLDFERPLPPLAVTTPQSSSEAQSLAKSAANLSQKRLAELMHISPRLAKLNAQRFRDFANLPQRQASMPLQATSTPGLKSIRWMRKPSHLRRTMCV